MNLLLFSSTFRLLRVYRATTSFNTSSSSFIARFHHHDGSFRTDRRVSDGEVIISYTEAWIAKVISTLCVLRCSKTSLDFTWFEYFSRSLNPLIAFEVVKRLNNPALALEFFRFSRVNCEEFNHSAKTYDFLVRSLCQMGHHEAASEVVFDGHLPDTSLLGFLASSCAEAGKLDIVKGLLIQAQSNEIGVNSFLYNNLLNVLIKRKRVNEAVSFFREQHLRSHFIPDTCSFNIVIRGLCRVGEVDRAFEFLHDMGSFGCSPDIVSYNTLINGLCRSDKVERGCELLKEIQSKYDFSPDVVTYTSVISGYCKLYKMKEAYVLFEEMVSLGIRPNSFTYNVLMDGFGKSGDMGFAMSMYQKMLLQGCPPDVVTLTSLIDGYCRSGQVDEAMKLWHEMGTRKLSPNAYTFAILINSFCKENRLNEAREFLRQLKWRDIVPQPFLYNPVIDGFCKAGNVDEANLIVSEMEDKRCNPDKLTYTILIIGHCMKGRMSEAITIFHKMLTTGCTPDTITLNSLTSCLCKAGMPNEANKIVLAVSKKNFDLIRSSSRKIDLARKNSDIPMAAY